MQNDYVGELTCAVKGAGYHKTRQTLFWGSWVWSSERYKKTAFFQIEEIEVSGNNYELPKSFQSSKITRELTISERKKGFSTRSAALS